MASIIPPFDPSNAPSVRRAEILLPDPERAVGDPLIRPGVARYAGSHLALGEIAPAAPLGVHSPVTGAVRLIDLDPAVLNLPTLLEISPLPFYVETQLQRIGGSVPTFYFGISHGDQIALQDDELIAEGQLLGTTGAPFYFGALFPDRLCLEPWSWATRLEAAVADGSWLAFTNALYPVNGSRTLKVLDHTGRTHPATGFRIVSNGVERAVTSDADGFLDVSATAGQAAELRWNGNVDAAADTSLPVLSLYETGASAEPVGGLALAADFVRGHVQLLELANWFAEPAASPTPLARYHGGSRVEPLVDGVDTFRLMAQDMLSCIPEAPPPVGDRPGAHFAGWAFKEIVFDKDLLDPNGEPYTFSGLVRLLTGPDGNGADVRALVNRVAQVTGDLDDEVQINAVIMTLLIAEVILVFSLAEVVSTDANGAIILTLAQLLSPVGVLAIADVNEKITEALDQSLEMFPLLNEIKPGIALRSLYPALHRDNPLFNAITAPLPSPITVTDFILGMGTWHQKMQLFKRATDKPDERGQRYVGYLGGIDVNGNRIDNFGHQKSGPYHDVHARVTGPGVADIFQSWEERYRFDLGRQSPPGLGLEPVFAPPAATDLPRDETAKHLLQIGRTLFRPRTPGNDNALPFAPRGDMSINDNMIRAIRGAREYIYIEDQYFVPNESNLPTPGYFDTLLAAADHCQRLVILVPSVLSLGDIPFGQGRKAELVRRLQERWGDRVLVGAPLRRPLLATAGRTTLEGRCILFEKVDALATELKIGPRARLPKALPFWLWVNGELMLAHDLHDEGELVDGRPVVKIDVLRGAAGSNPLWGAYAREHEKGSAVTASQLRGIFVHAKIMMVDDVHLTIGSANLNRRGLFHDGEIGVFAIPERLKAAGDNPARDLRTRLWAEQLGLPPAMGPVLLQDPIAAFELFHRHFFAGNRFVPLSFFDTNDSATLQLSVSSNLLANALSNFGLGWMLTQREEIWNTFVDPTTVADPDPVPGP